MYTPSLRRFPNNAQAIGTPSVRTSLVDDVYLSLLTSLEQGRPLLCVIIEFPRGVDVDRRRLIAEHRAGTLSPGRLCNLIDSISAPVADRQRAAVDPKETLELTGVLN